LHPTPLGRACCIFVFAASRPIRLHFLQAWTIREGLSQEIAVGLEMQRPEPKGSGEDQQATDETHYAKAKPAHDPGEFLHSGHLFPSIS
jgi:hypothetical protein